MKSMMRSPSYLFIVFSILMFLIFISCQEDETPIEPKNHKPTITKLTATPDSILVNKLSLLKCIANDEEKDKLSFRWSSKLGKFIDGNEGDSVIWKAPSNTGLDTINITVSDGKENVTQCIEIFIGDIPSKPVLLYPTANEENIKLSVQLSWTEIENADSYHLQFSLNNNFKSLLINKYGLTNVIEQLTGLSANTNYYWRVRSKNIFGYSDWSTVFSFKTFSQPSAPILVSPKNSSSKINLAPEFVWNKIYNADNYILQISLNDTFTNLVVNQKGIIDTSKRIYGLEYFTTYYWRVKAINSCCDSDWSTIYTFSTKGVAPLPPILLSPEFVKIGVDKSTKLYWQESEHAENYTLQVAEDSLFSKIFYEESGLIEKSKLISGMKNTQKYYWRVKAENNYGSSDWSRTFTFTTLLPHPTLTLPINNALDLSPSPVLSWDKIEDAESYALQISTDSTFSKIIYYERDITENNKQINGLNTFTKYYWRVNASNKNGLSEWSRVNSINVTGYFYRGYDYGNQALFNPAYVLLSGGFDMIQVGNRRNIKDFPYNIAVKNIWKNLSDPFTPINNYGWWNFIKDQVLPLSLNKKNAQFWPNYTLHLIGGGMEYAALEEWFEYNKYPYPEWLSAFTIMSYHLINEVAENGTHVGDDVDPIADIYIFDIGGILLFTSKSVRRFFAEDLNLADWSQQPSFSVRNGELHNNGQFFSVKWKFPFSDSWHAFYYFGTNGVGGLSYKFKDGTGLSLGLGLAASDLILLDEKTNKKTLGLVGNFGFFYDKNNSLLASIAVTIKTDYMINVNIYPGLIKIGDISPGIWGAYSQDKNVILGFSFSWLPFGFAQSTR